MELLIKENDLEESLNQTFDDNLTLQRVLKEGK